MGNFGVPWLVYFQAIPLLLRDGFWTCERDLVDGILERVGESDSSWRSWQTSASSRLYRPSSLINWLWEMVYLLQERPNERRWGRRVCTATGNMVYNNDGDGDVSAPVGEVMRRDYPLDWAIPLGLFTVTAGRKYFRRVVLLSADQNRVSMSHTRNFEKDITCQLQIWHKSSITRLHVGPQSINIKPQVVYIIKYIVHQHIRNSITV